MATSEPRRRAWSRPELIVLVRGRPEEAVLSGCKGNPDYVAANGTYSRCGFTFDCATGCDAQVAS